MSDCLNVFQMTLSDKTLLLGLLLAIGISMLAAVCSSLFRKVAKGSGLLRRLFAHGAFFPVYIACFYFMTEPELGVSGGGTPVQIVDGAILYLLFFTVWEGVLGKVERSVTFKMISVINQSTDTVPCTCFQDCYPLERMIHTRIEAMDRHGYIIRKGDTIMVTRKGALCAKILKGISLFFYGKHKQ